MSLIDDTMKAMSTTTIKIKATAIIVRETRTTMSTTTMAKRATSTPISTSTST